MILIIKKSQSKLYDISKHHSIHRCTKLYRNLGKLCYYEMKKNLAATMAVIAAITLAATMMTFAGFTTITQQANAQPINTGSNTGSCTMTSTASGSGTVGQSCSISQGMCQLAPQGGRDTTGIINSCECS